jgi:hypothetical protein
MTTCERKSSKILSNICHWQLVVSSASLIRSRAAMFSFLGVLFGYWQYLTVVGGLVSSIIGFPPSSRLYISSGFSSALTHLTYPSRACRSAFIILRHSGSPRMIMVTPGHSTTVGTLRPLSPLPMLPFTPSASRLLKYS